MRHVYGASTANTTNVSTVNGQFDVVEVLEIKSRSKFMPSVRGKSKHCEHDTLTWKSLNWSLPMKT
jgi:hypothetical protein